MLEAQLKDDLLYIYKVYNEKGLSIGAAYYVYKDAFNDISNIYNNHLKEQMQKQKEAEE